MLDTIRNKALAGGAITSEEALWAATVPAPAELFALADAVRRAHRGNQADLCSIVSAKTGACPEDCRYCAQSAAARTEIKTHALMNPSEITDRASRARAQGARRFCIVTSGKRPTPEELGRIGEMVGAVRTEGLLPCATLGLLGVDELRALKAAGLHRYHHNLETSRRFFPEICSTHTYDQKLTTIEAARTAGLSLCSGGIFGLGETWEDRIEMAMELRDLKVDSVPINFLVPVKGTPLGDTERLDPIEALRIISVYRLIMPEREIRVCGGRVQTLGQMNSMVFLAGADGLLTGDCLTVSGRDPAEDLELVRLFGMTT